jgi:hypothetical protein
LRDKVYAAGAVGLALPYELKVGVEFGLEAMGEPMTVERYVQVTGILC